MPTCDKGRRHRPNDKSPCLMCLIRRKLPCSTAFHTSILSQKYFKPA